MNCRELKNQILQVKSISAARELFCHLKHFFISDPAFIPGDFLQTGQIGFNIFISKTAEGYASGDQGAIQTVVSSNAQTTIVKISTSTSTSGKFFTFDVIQYDRMLKMASVETTDRNGEMRYSVDKIRGAIQWINNPFIVTVIALN